MYPEIKIGNRYGRWEVMKLVPKSYTVCKCDCGVVKLVAISSLRNGDSTSCGCRRREVAKTTNLKHGQSNSETHKTWMKMNVRCNNPNYPEYHLYGGRGITICDRWKVYENFLNDMGDRPFNKAQIDRIDNSGNYEPSNCRWVTCSENGRNKRNSVHLTFKGVTKHIYEWAQEIGVNAKTLKTRLSNGWPLERVLTEPAFKGKNQTYAELVRVP